MATPFIGEIRIFAGNFAPTGWALCNGQLLPIIQNTALFSLLGTNYGGDGQQTFALPNLQGRVPIHTGSSGATYHTLGEQGGAESVTLSVSQMPAHNHLVTAAGGPNEVMASNPKGHYLGPSGLNPSGPIEVYTKSDPPAMPVSMNPAMVNVTGGSQPTSVLQPYLTLTFIIALQGIFPSRN